MRVRLHVRLIAKRQLTVGAAVQRHHSQVEDWTIKDRASLRGAVDEPGAVRQPAKSLQHPALTDGSSLAGGERHDIDEDLGPGVTGAFKCDRLIVRRPAG